MYNSMSGGTMDSLGSDDEGKQLIIKKNRDKGQRSKKNPVSAGSASSYAFN